MNPQDFSLHCEMWLHGVEQAASRAPRFSMVEDAKFQCKILRDTHMWRVFDQRMNCFALFQSMECPTSTGLYSKEEVLWS